MSKFWVLVCILSLISCVNKQEEDYIVAVEEITFPGVKGYVESYYYDSLENKEYLSFFTIRSVDDSLKVFEFPSANFLYSVPMYALWDTLNGLSMLMEKRMKDMENTLFLITTPQYVQFYTSDLNNSNVLVDENISFVEEANGLFNTSMVFYVGENKLDTLIELNASMLQAQIDYIASH